MILTCCVSVALFRVKGSKKKIVDVTCASPPRLEALKLQK